VNSNTHRLHCNRVSAIFSLFFLLETTASIIDLPTKGSLFQLENEERGAPVMMRNTLVLDPSLCVMMTVRPVVSRDSFTFCIRKPDLIAENLVTIKVCNLQSFLFGHSFG